MIKMKMLASTIFVVLIVYSPAWADIYKWVDERGVVHYSDTPPSSDEPTSEIESLPTHNGESKPTHDVPSKPPNNYDSKKTGTVGTTFGNIDELFDYYETKGFVILGRFGKSQWPAKIVYEKEAMDEISFVLKKGGTHAYPGYVGYRLKVVSLEDSEGEERVVVLRSKEKITSN